jgi:hypothetical protein
VRMLCNSGKSLTSGPLKPLIVPRKAPVDGSNASQRITVTVFDQSGAHLTSANDYGGFGPCRFFCEWPVYAVENQLGVIQFQSSGGLTGAGLRFSPSGSFTSVPIIR